MNQNDQAGGGPLDGGVRPGSEAPRWWHCDTHGAGKLSAWGCPDCVADLRRWKSTHAPRLQALEGLLNAAQMEADAGREAVATLASEREANALLTGEVEQLRIRLGNCREWIEEALSYVGCESWSPSMLSEGEDLMRRLRA